MPQRPALRHLLAKIRLECGLSQKELAKLLGVAPITIQKIEQGILQLSEDLAQRAQTELDISAAWLLANDPKSIAVNPRDGKWSRQLYEFAQGTGSIVTALSSANVSTIANKLFGGSTGSAGDFSTLLSTSLGARIHAMLHANRNTPKQGILLHRLNRMIEALEKDFSSDQSVLDQYAPKIAKLKAAFARKARQIAQEETKRLWADREKEPKA